MQRVKCSERLRNEPEYARVGVSRGKIFALAQRSERESQVDLSFRILKTPFGQASKLNVACAICCIK